MSARRSPSPPRYNRSGSSSTPSGPSRYPTSRPNGDSHRPNGDSRSSYSSTSTSRPSSAAPRSRWDQQSDSRPLPTSRSSTLPASPAGLPARPPPPSSSRPRSPSPPPPAPRDRERDHKYSNNGPSDSYSSNSYRNGATAESSYSSKRPRTDDGPSYSASSSHHARSAPPPPPPPASLSQRASTSSSSGAPYRNGTAGAPPPPPPTGPRSLRSEHLTRPPIHAPTGPSSSSAPLSAPTGPRASRPPPPPSFSTPPKPVPFHYKPLGSHDFRVTYNPSLDQSSVKRSKEVEKRIDGEGVESGSVVDPRKGGKGTEEEKRRLKDAGRRAERRKKVEVIAYLWDKNSPGPAPPPPPSAIVVSGYPSTVTETNLRTNFLIFGRIETLSMEVDKNTGGSLGVCWIKFFNDVPREGADKATMEKYEREKRTGKAQDGTEVAKEAAERGNGQKIGVRMMIDNVGVKVQLDGDRSKCRKLAEAELAFKTANKLATTTTSTTATPTTTASSTYKPPPPPPPPSSAPVPPPPSFPNRFSSSTPYSPAPPPPHQTSHEPPHINGHPHLPPIHLTHPLPLPPRPFDHRQPLPSRPGPQYASSSIPLPPHSPPSAPHNHRLSQSGPSPPTGPRASRPSSRPGPTDPYVPIVYSGARPARLPPSSKVGGPGGGMSKAIEEAAMRAKRSLESRKRGEEDMDLDQSDGSSAAEEEMEREDLSKLPEEEKYIHWDGRIERRKVLPKGQAPANAIAWQASKKVLKEKLAQNGRSYVLIEKGRFVKDREGKSETMVGGKVVLNGGDLERHFGAFDLDRTYADSAGWYLTFQSHQTAQRAYDALHQRKFAGASLELELCPPEGLESSWTTSTAATTSKPAEASSSSVPKVNETASQPVVVKEKEKKTSGWTDVELVEEARTIVVDELMEAFRKDLRTRVLAGQVKRQLSAWEQEESVTPVPVATTTTTKKEEVSAPKTTSATPEVSTPGPVPILTTVPLTSALGGLKSLSSLPSFSRRKPSTATPRPPAPSKQRSRRQTSDAPSDSHSPELADREDLPTKSSKKKSTTAQAPRRRPRDPSESEEDGEEDGDDEAANNNNHAASSRKKSPKKPPRKKVNLSYTSSEGEDEEDDNSTKKQKSSKKVNGGGKSKSKRPPSVSPELEPTVDTIAVVDTKPSPPTLSLPLPDATNVPKPLAFGSLASTSDIVKAPSPSPVGLAFGGGGLAFGGATTPSSSSTPAKVAGVAGLAFGAAKTANGGGLAFGSGAGGLAFGRLPRDRNGPFDPKSFFQDPAPESMEEDGPVVVSKDQDQAAIVAKLVKDDDQDEATPLVVKPDPDSTAMSDNDADLTEEDTRRTAKRARKIARQQARQARLDAQTPDPFDRGLAADEEDLFYVKLAIERNRTGATLHPTPPPSDDEDDPPARHPTGSARTEGYYTISVAEKMANRPTSNKAKAQLDAALPGAASGVAVSRLARANTRGLVRGMELHKKVTATDTDVLKFNQLRTRKKQLTFSRSGIEGYGLFATEHIQAGEMVIEYVGELIRQQVADLREKAYERQGIGSSYLFRVDEDLVVDATKKGNLGRLINHCCVPNCTAKIITISGVKKIVIYAKTNIEPGEEVTYDYHFQREDDNKIPCLCGAAGCRKYLNCPRTGMNEGISAGVNFLVWTLLTLFSLYGAAGAIMKRRPWVEWFYELIWIHIWANCILGIWWIIARSTTYAKEVQAAYCVASIVGANAESTFDALSLASILVNCQRSIKLSLLLVDFTWAFALLVELWVVLVAGHCLDEFAELDGLAKGYDIDALEPYKWVSDSTSQTRKSKSKSKKSSRSKGYSAV